MKKLDEWLYEISLEHLRDQSRFPDVRVLAREVYMRLGYGDGTPEAIFITAAIAAAVEMGGS